MGRGKQSVWRVTLVSLLGGTAFLLVSAWSSRHFRPSDLREPGGYLGRPTCDRDLVISRFSRAPEEETGWFARLTGFVTTPLKRLGVQGWSDTGCNARVLGSAVRDAEGSHDFWTIDLRLESLEVQGSPASAERRFVRVEVADGTRAHDLAEEHPVRAGDRIAAAGPVLVDADGPFLEIHPDREFELAGRASGYPPVEER